MKIKLKIFTAICLAGIVLLSACSERSGTAPQESTPQETFATVSQTEAPATEPPTENSDKIEVFAGPGEDYAKIIDIPKTRITEILKYEKDWYEVDYGDVRGYVRAGDLPDTDKNTVPHVVYSITQNVYPYPTVYYTGIDITLFDEAEAFATTGHPRSPIVIGAGESVTLLCHETSQYEEYVQIEFSAPQGKYRGYCEINDLLSLDNPLLNFDGVKESSAKITYNGKTYYSTTGEPTPISKGWYKEADLKLQKTQIDWLAGITGVIAGNDINSEALNPNGEGFKVVDSKHRTVYSNANVGNKKIATCANIADFLLGSTISFVDSGVKKTEFYIRMDNYKGESRIIIKTGSPFEAPRRGTEITLSQLIADRNGSPLDLINQKKLADEQIKKIYPSLNKDKTYSMTMKFSDDFSEDPYGYYLIIDSSGDVYANPIIHKGTSFPVYSGGDFVADATWEFNKAMIKVDDTTKSALFSLLEENGFSIEL